MVYGRARRGLSREAAVEEFSTCASKLFPARNVSLRRFAILSFRLHDRDQHKRCRNAPDNQKTLY